MRLARGMNATLGPPLLCALGVLAPQALGAAPLQTPPKLSSVSPAEQRVGEVITLRGSNFGAYQPGVSRVVFRLSRQSVGGIAWIPAVPHGSGQEYFAGTPYVWRDDFIQVRVPVGRRAGRQIQPIPKLSLVVKVRTANGDSAPLRFQVAYEEGGALSFQQLTQLSGHDDVSGFLGATADNQARTKDGEVGDVNGDGYPDLIDANSDNLLNGTHEILRVNRADGLGFVSLDWEPLDSTDSGSFAVTVPNGGDYYGDGISYDSDFVDLNGDGLVDWVHAVGHTTGRLRVCVNNYQGIPGRFVEATSTWVLQQPSDPSLDDVAHADLNIDGFVDVGTSARFSSNSYVYMNDGGVKLHPPVTVTHPGSIHDIFLVDANLDGYTDVVLVSESTTCRLFLNDGNPIPGFTGDETFNLAGLAGVSGDFDGDGRPDVALAGYGGAFVYLNGPSGKWKKIVLGGSSTIYDLETGDLDLDGDLDLLAAVITRSADAAVIIWTNDGDGTFTNLTAGNATAILPGLGGYQRLSADLIDFDLDGDPDLYVTGADSQNVFGSGFGRVPNQFWENLTR